MKRWQRERIRRALKVVRSGKLFRLRFCFEWELTESELDAEEILLQLAHVREVVALHIEQKTAEVQRIINAQTEREVSEGGDDL